MTQASKRAVVFGTGSYAEVVDFYLAADSDYRVAAFTATADVIASDTYLGRPLVAFETIEERFPR